DAASLLRLKLILDMRDTWSAWAIAPFKTRLHYWLVKSAERRLFQQASHIVTVTDEVREIFVRDHGEHLRSKVSIIPNSFVRPLPPTVYYPGFRSKELITIGYVGSFYFRPDLNFEMKRKWYRRKGLKKFEYYSSKEDWLYRSPYFFLSALKLILLEHPELSGRVKVEFIGQRHNWLVDMVEGMGLTSMCIFNGFLAKEALDKKILGFDYLLATSEKVINGRHFCLPSKLFEYISYGKPILGFVTKGSQMDFIEKSRAGRVFNPDELEVAAAQLLETLYHQGVSVIDQEYLENFSLSRNCKTLSKIIWDCAVSSTEAPVLASWKQ
ncbi:MAG TPA: hypothetical protein VK616_09980, partial [Flavitalea sp.]|nr:hypothetical protein [Flavitalea sp.]